VLYFINGWSRSDHHQRRLPNHAAAAATAASALQQPQDLFCGQFTILKVVVHLTMLL
jgi:hypothetical protein